MLSLVPQLSGPGSNVIDLDHTALVELLLNADRVLVGLRSPEERVQIKKPLS